MDFRMIIEKIGRWPGENVSPVLGSAMSFSEVRDTWRGSTEPPTDQEVADAWVTVQQDIEAMNARYQLLMDDETNTGRRLEDLIDVLLLKGTVTASDIFGEYGPAREKWDDRKANRAKS